MKEFDEMMTGGSRTTALLAVFLLAGQAAPKGYSENAAAGVAAGRGQLQSNGRHGGWLRENVYPALALSQAPRSQPQQAVKINKEGPATRPAPGTAGPNLVVNGDFEKPDASGQLPEGWSTKHPDNVKLVDSAGPRKRVVQMTGDKKLMGTYGADLTGGKIAFKPNTRYRCTGYTRSDGPKLIVFVKGYATLTRQVDGQPRTSEDAVYQMRKELKPSPDWQPFNLDFDVKPAGEFSDFQQKVEHLRITLWAYWPEGTCWYDDIRFEEVGPLPAAQRRHSEAVTHAGVKPRVNAASRPAEPDIDEEQLWLDGANAFRAAKYDQAIRLATQLMARNPARGDYRLLAARTAAKLKDWPQADAHARWLLEDPTPAATQPARKVEPWQREWARVVRAEVMLRTGRPDEARVMLEALVREAQSEHARSAAKELLR